MSKIAVVIFPNNSYSKEYYFRTNIQNLEEGTLVVVDTINGFVTADFVRYHEEPVKQQPAKWVVAEVDLTDHFVRIKAEERAAAIKKQLDKAKKEIEEMAVYEMLAKHNPGILDLVNELKQLKEVL